MEDTNVLFQDAVSVYRELVKAGKEVNVEPVIAPPKATDSEATSNE